MKSVELILIIITILAVTTLSRKLKTKTKSKGDAVEINKCKGKCFGSGFKLSEFARESTFVCECGNKTYFASSKGSNMEPVETEKIPNIKQLASQLRLVKHEGPSLTPAQTTAATRPAPAGSIKNAKDQAAANKLKVICAGGAIYLYEREDTYFTKSCPNGKYYYVKGNGQPDLIQHDKIENIQGLIPESRRIA